MDRRVCPDAFHDAVTHPASGLFLDHGLGFARIERNRAHRLCHGAPLRNQIDRIDFRRAHQECAFHGHQANRTAPDHGNSRTGMNVRALQPMPGRWQIVRQQNGLVITDPVRNARQAKIRDRYHRIFGLHALQAGAEPIATPAMRVAFIHIARHARQARATAHSGRDHDPVACPESRHAAASLDNLAHGFVPDAIASLLAETVALIDM